MKRKVPKTVFTVGHSTRTLDEFIRVLKGHSIELLADVRTVPRSRKNPQFNIDTLPGALSAAGIGYIHMKGLGGLRKASKDSPNSGWINDSFRGFADYMQTADFATGLEELMESAEGKRTAVMCAEGNRWRCHRSLIADALTIRGIEVLHITSATGASPHAMTPFAKVEGKRITYPPQEGNDRNEKTPR